MHGQRIAQDIDASGDAARAVGDALDGQVGEVDRLFALGSGAALEVLSDLAGRQGLEPDLGCRRPPPAVSIKAGAPASTT
jgi:hypothetical protein